MRKIRLAIIFVLAVGCLTGCASDAKKYDTNTIIVKKSGAVEEVAVEDYSDSSVKAEDLKTYIEEQITAYNDENGKNAVKRQSLNTEDMSKAKLLLSYKSMNDFNEFNSLECSFADVADVKESDLSGSYKSAEDNKSAKKADILETKKAKVLTLSEKTNVVVKGTLLYYNDQVKVKDDVISTTGKENAIIIFK